MMGLIYICGGDGGDISYDDVEDGDADKFFSIYYSSLRLTEVASYITS